MFKRITLISAFILLIATKSFAQISNKKEFDKTFKHQTAIVNNVKIHFVKGGAGEPLVLLHGFPETWYAWRKIMPRLAQKYTVIAPDLRGLGDSEKTIAGYDKRTVAEDVYQLAQKLGLKQFFLVGHDFGGSTAYALAANHPSAVRRVVAIECVPAGLLTTDELANTVGKYFGSRSWFQAFHQVKNLPEQLIEGREQIYLQWLYDNFTVNKAAFAPADYQTYFRAYSQKGAMRAALEYYRSQSIDAEHNKTNAKLAMPILTVGCAGSLRDTTFLAFQKVANDVRGIEFKDCGHFPAEEKPAELTAEILQFFTDGKQ